MTERLSDERLSLISEDAQCVSGSLEIKAMAHELLELRAKLAEQPKLEWKGTDLYLGSLSLGFVDDTEIAWNAYAGCDPDPIGYGLGNAEARAAVEAAVRKALGRAGE